MRVKLLVLVLVLVGCGSTTDLVTGNTYTTETIYQTHWNYGWDYWAPYYNYGWARPIYRGRGFYRPPVVYRFPQPRTRTRIVRTKPIPPPPPKQTNKDKM